MNGRAYYNEIDPYAAQWLRNLIGGGHIAPGDVDERSIVDVRAGDLAGYTQCHFFAGIGGWSLALRLSGWSDDRPVWTGSVPCQPLSSAGRRQGHSDRRHLWPAFYELIAERGPPELFGEQVANALGFEWFAAVRADLEVGGYACGAANLCAAGVGAPHIRQRLYWCAHANGPGRQGYQPHLCSPRRAEAPLTLIGDPLAGARRVLAIGDGGLLPGDGLSVGVERRATHGYGNAIVPQVAAQFIGAYLDVRGR